MNKTTEELRADYRAAKRATSAADSLAAQKAHLAALAWAAQMEAWEPYWAALEKEQKP